jgi:hypothetical protein
MLTSREITQRANALCERAGALQMEAIPFLRNGRATQGKLFYTAGDRLFAAARQLYGEADAAQRLELNLPLPNRDRSRIQEGVRLAEVQAVTALLLVEQ